MCRRARSIAGRPFGTVSGCVSGWSSSPHRVYECVRAAVRACGSRYCGEVGGPDGLSSRRRAAPPPDTTPPGHPPQPPQPGEEATSCSRAPSPPRLPGAWTEVSGRVGLAGWAAGRPGCGRRGSLLRIGSRPRRSLHVLSPALPHSLLPGKALGALFLAAPRAPLPRLQWTRSPPPTPPGPAPGRLKRGGGRRARVPEERTEGPERPRGWGRSGEARAGGGRPGSCIPEAAGP